MFTENDIKNIDGMMKGQAPVAPTPPVVQTPAPVPEPATDALPAAVVQPPATPPVATPPVTTAAIPPPAAVTTEDTEDQYDHFDPTELGYDSMDHLLETMEALKKENTRLSEYKSGPKFKSDRHKLLYDVAGEADGMELERARRLMDIVSLDLTKMSDQQIRFENFKNDPVNKGLTQDELRVLFQDEDLKRFGDSSDVDNPQTETQKLRARQATNIAKEELSKLQTNWRSARVAEKTPEEVAAEAQDYREFLVEQTTGFEGIQLALAAKNENGEKLEGSLNYKLDPQKQLPAVIEALANPAAFWEDLLTEEGIMADGQKIPDFQKFASLVTFIQNRYSVINNAYQQGREDEKAHRLKTQRNVADPATTTGTAVTETPKKTGMAAANEAAMKLVGTV